MGKLQKLGASNKFFFYAMCENATSNLKLKIRIPGLRLDYMKQAFQEALKRYPEIAVKMFVKDNVLVSEVLEEEVVFLPEGSKPQKFGTDSLNGYMFYVLYNEDGITVSYYHGLTDIKGMEEYLRCSFYLYATYTGFEFTKEELEELLPSFRQEGDFEKMDNKEDLLDPYHLFGDITVKPDNVFPYNDAFVIPVSTDPEDVEYYNSALITLDLADTLKMAKGYGSSMLPLLNDIATTAIYDTFDVQGKPIITMAPVDQRPYVGSKTVVNCSDSIFYAYTADDRRLSREERVKKWYRELKEKATTNNFIVQMGCKAAAVDSFEKDSVSIDEQVKEMNMLPPKGSIRPVSYGITYPGKMTLLTGLDRMINDFALVALFRGPAVIGDSFGNALRIRVLERSHEAKFADCIFKGFKDAGLNPVFEYEGKQYFDILRIEELDHEQL